MAHCKPFTVPNMFCWEILRASIAILLAGNRHSWKVEKVSSPYCGYFLTPFSLSTKIAETDKCLPNHCSMDLQDGRKAQYSPCTPGHEDTLLNSAKLCPPGPEDTLLNSAELCPSGPEDTQLIDAECAHLLAVLSHIFYSRKQMLLISCPPNQVAV